MRSKTLSETAKTRTLPALALARNLYSRFFWLPLVYTIFLIVFAATYLPSVLQTMAAGRLTMPAEQVWPSLVDTVAFRMVFTYFVAIVVSTFFGCTLFSYLNQTASTGFLHALPVRRGKIYLTYWLTGLSLLLLPPALTALFMLTVLRAGAAFTFLWLALVALYSTVVFSGAVTVSLLAGNNVASTAFTVFAIFLPLITEGFLDLFLQNTVYGLPGEYLSFVSKWFYLNPQLLVGPSAWIYAVYTALFFLAGLLLFKKRQMENAGNLLAFPRFRAFALYICALIIGMIAYLLFDANKYMFLVFGVLAAVVINFPMRKRFTLKGAILPALALVVTALAVFAIVKFDLTGYERYLPEAKDVAEVRVGQNRYNMEYLYEPRTETRDGAEVTYVPEFEGFRTQGEIENVIFLHHYLIEQKGRELPDDEQTLYIEYILKDGRHKTRLYNISYTRDADELRPVLESAQLRAYNHSFLRPGTEVTVKTLENEFTGSAKLTDEEAEQVLAALREDVLAIPFEKDPAYFERRTAPFAYLSYTTRRIEASREETKPQKADVPAASADRGDIVFLYADFKKTIALLSSMGYGEYLTLPGDLPDGYSAEITRYGGGKYYEETSYTLPAADYTEKSVVVTDPDDVLSLMKFFEDASNAAVTEEQRRSDLSYSVCFSRIDRGGSWYTNIAGFEPALEAMILKYQQ